MTRLRQPQPADTHRPVAVGGGPVAAFGTDRGQVGAGAEDLRPHCVQHRNRGVGIGIERAWKAAASSKRRWVHRRRYHGGPGGAGRRC